MLVNVIVCSTTRLNAELSLCGNVDTACRSSTEIRPFVAKIKLKKGIC